MEILVRERGNIIQIADAHCGPTPQEVRSIVERPLYYEYRTHNVGFDQYTRSTGDYSPVSVEYRRAYQYDGGDRLCCMRGFGTIIVERLRAAGHTVTWQRLDPPKPDHVYHEDWDSVVSRFTFRPMQDECLIAVASNDMGVIDAAPAFGKMWVIAMICTLYPNAKIDVVTKRRPVVDSIANLLAGYLPSVGKVCSGSREQGRVTVYTLDSLHHSDFDADIVLVDEVHEAVTDRYATAIGHYWDARVYGFTATTDTRADGLQHRITGLCGPTIFEMTQQRAEELKLVTPVVVYWLDIDIPTNPAAHTTHPSYRKQYGIWTNRERNKRIAAAARRYYERDMQILVSVDTIEHGLHLQKLLPEFELCYSENGLKEGVKREKLEMSVGDLSHLPPMTREHKRNMQKRFESGELRAAIATSTWRVGVSFNALQVFMRVDGGRSATDNVQAPGRVCRIAPGKEFGIVIDCYDVFDPTFKAASLARRRAYAARGWRQFDAKGRPWDPATRRRKRRV